MITIKSLRVDYDDVNAVNDLNLEIKDAQIFGLVGPNGAGKTSTIKALANILKPTYGEIKIAGHDLELETEQALSSLGYMPDFSPVYENLCAWEYLDVFAAAYLLPRQERLSKVEYWLAKVNLTEKRNSLVRELSRGMRQRLVLAKTLIHDPKVLLLDEPASGLDPVARKDLQNILKEVAESGKTILISSHILTELSDFCNAVGIMEKGKMVVSGSVEEIRKKIGAKSDLYIRLASKDPQHLSHLISLLSTNSLTSQPVAADSSLIKANFLGDEYQAAQLLNDLVRQNFSIAEFYLKQANIEDIFFKIGAKEVS